MEETMNVLLSATETTAAALAQDASSSIAVEPANFVSNLQYMGMGMLGIFIVIAAIWGVTVALNKLFSEKPKADNEN